MSVELFVAFRLGSRPITGSSVIKDRSLSPGNSLNVLFIHTFQYCHYFVIVLQKDTISTAEFTFEKFIDFYNRLCTRQDLDNIFAHL